MTDVPDKLAYGANEVEGCVCPAVAAGENPTTEHDMARFARAYDLEMSRRMYAEKGYDPEILDDNPGPELTHAGVHRGVVDVETAKEAWFSTIAELPRDSPRRAAGLNVARKLGWLRAGGVSP